MDYILYALTWIIWCTLHSVLISQGLTKLAQKKLGDSFRYYRLGYNLFSTISLLLPLWYGLRLRGEPIFNLDGVFAPLRFSLFFLALFFFIAGARRYDMARFTGIFQAVTGKGQTSIAANDELDTSGIHQITRHPWYIGGILLLWSYQSGFDLQSTISSTLLTLYFIIGAVLEEKKLTAVFGQRYSRYQEEVSMLIPWKWMQRLLKKNVSR